MKTIHWFGKLGSRNVNSSENGAYRRANIRTGGKCGVERLDLKEEWRRAEACLKLSTVSAGEEDRSEGVREFGRGRMFGFQSAAFSLWPAAKKGGNESRFPL